MDTITDEQIRTLRDEAGTAGDADQVALCNLALNEGEHTLVTSSGYVSGSLREIAEWQDEHQGNHAFFDDMAWFDLRDVDFEADRDGGYATVISKIQAKARERCVRAIHHGGAS